MAMTGLYLMNREDQRNLFLIAAAVALAAEKKVEIQFDPVAKAPYFYYKDENGALHVVWFEDARSVLAKLDLVKKYNLGGVSFWTVMNYFPQAFAVLNSNFQEEKA